MESKSTVFPEDLAVVKETGRKLNIKLHNGKLVIKDQEVIQQYDELVKQLNEDELLFAICCYDNEEPYAEEIESKLILLCYNTAIMIHNGQHRGFFAVKTHELVKHNSYYQYKQK